MVDRLISTWRTLFVFTWALAIAVAEVSPRELSDAISKKITEVPEFAFIRREAEKMGVKVYLFGGTAAAFGLYVRWDTLSTKGDKRFQRNRFDYDYTNIFRSNQDLDIVIDGPPEKAAELQARLHAQFDYFQGNKSAWEVRPLRENMGSKEAILGNPNFLNQHSDSNSTGLIEITQPIYGESVVRDVRDWGNRESYFLKDIADGKLHYYFSPKHETTSRFQEGLNPPILSVIRFLTKAYQYDLKIRAEDLMQIRAIIDAFDPKKVSEAPYYVATWIEKNAKKLIQNAVNMESAKESLEDLGLLKKLRDIKGNINEKDSLAWWMEKEPLKTKPLGKTGRTARELGIDIVTHETNSFLAYESITRAHTGEPNVLISRSGREGENALYGNGFYTLRGKSGYWNQTKINIRFQLNPDAREGHDFIFAERDTNMVIITNKAAIQVIPESIQFEPITFFKMLAEGALGLEETEQAAIEKFKRRARGRLLASTTNERQRIYEYIKELLGKPNVHSLPVILGEWSKMDPEFFAKLISEIKTGSREKYEHFLLGLAQMNPRNPEFGKAILTGLKGSSREFREQLFDPLFSRYTGQTWAPKRLGPMSDQQVAEAFSHYSNAEILNIPDEKITLFEKILKGDNVHDPDYRLPVPKIGSAELSKNADRLADLLVMDNGELLSMKGGTNSPDTMKRVVVRILSQIGNHSSKVDQALAKYAQDLPSTSWLGNDFYEAIISTNAPSDASLLVLFEHSRPIRGRMGESVALDSLEHLKKTVPDFESRLEGLAKKANEAQAAGLLNFVGGNHALAPSLVMRLLNSEDGYNIEYQIFREIDRHPDLLTPAIREMIIKKFRIEYLGPDSIEILTKHRIFDPEVVFQFVKARGRNLRVQSRSDSYDTSITHASNQYFALIANSHKEMPRILETIFKERGWDGVFEFVNNFRFIKAIPDKWVNSLTSYLEKTDKEKLATLLRQLSEKTWNSSNKTIEPFPNEEMERKLLREHLVKIAIASKNPTRQVALNALREFTGITENDARRLSRSRVFGLWDRDSVVKDFLESTEREWIPSPKKPGSLCSLFFGKLRK